MRNREINTVRNTYHILFSSLFVVSIEEAKQQLAAYAAENSKGIYKVRLLAGKNGELAVQGASVSSIMGPVDCALASSPINRHDPFLFHKTTNRLVYDEQQKAGPANAFMVLLWNENNELTEFTIGNLVVEKDGRFFTPPVLSGVLSGTYRQYLLDRREIEEKVIYKEELAEFDTIWFINSVRGWLKVDLM